MRSLCLALALAWLSLGSCLTVVDKPKDKRKANLMLKPKHTAMHAAKHAAKHAASETHTRHPRYARTGTEHIETVWQRPRGNVKGIFFIAHGCGHQATDIFSDVGPDGWKFDSCNTSNFGRCLGLPEEVAMRKVARKHGYLVMATSGGSGRQSCFDVTRDPPRIQEAIKYVLQTEGLPDGMHVFATGAASGGHLMGALAGPLSQGGLPNLKCIVPQISSIDTTGHRGVPTIYVHMPRDERTAETIAAQIKLLKSKGVHTTELRVQPNPVDEKLLLKCVTNTTARKIITAFKRRNFTDKAGYLYEDARRTKWMLPVTRLLGNSSSDALTHAECCISELMNVAWAQHEFSSEYSEEILAFCERKFSEIRSHY